MSIKGLSYDVTEWPPTLHAPMQFVLFRARTVPALKLDGEKVSGSRAIMRRLDRLTPEPPLYPADATARARVEEAERWGDEVFQPVARELIWAASRTVPARWSATASTRGLGCRRLRSARSRRRWPAWGRS